MFGLLRFFYLIFVSAKDVMHPDLNPLRLAPPHIKYFASILLACFWSLAFGLYIGELLMIGYNMLGHIAVISMAFGTWAVFREFKKNYDPKPRALWLRQPDFSSRCDELSDEERLVLANKFRD